MDYEGEIRVKRSELVELGSEIFLRLLLKEKGLPMEGTFLPALMLNEYQYTVYDDNETGDKIYKYRAINPTDTP